MKKVGDIIPFLPKMTRRLGDIYDIIIQFFIYFFSIYFARWWFQICLLSPLIGEDFQFDSYFFRWIGSTTNQIVFIWKRFESFWSYHYCVFSSTPPNSANSYNWCFGVRWFGFLGFLMKGIVSQTTNYPNQHPNNQLFQIFTFTI